MFIYPTKSESNSNSGQEILMWDHQMKANVQHFHLALFITLNKVVATIECCDYEHNTCVKLFKT